MKIVRKPIEMVGYFPKTNIPKPLKYKILDEDEPWNIIKVENVISTELEKLAGNKMYVFTCESIINNTLKIYQMKYELDTCKWMLWKI